MPKLFYRASDCGDGSVSVHFHNSDVSARLAEHLDIEKIGYGYGESTVNFVDLRVVDGQIEFGSFEYDEERKAWSTIWRRLGE